jgi:stage II sporulation SpoE-like protein
MTLMRRASQQPSITPAEILRQVNAALSEDNKSFMFVTLFVGILNLQTGELRFSNAGHNPPLILAANRECRFLALPDGLVLGVMADAEYLDDTVRLDPGDMIMTHTDGVTEAMNPAHVLYSEARLRKTLAALAGRGVEDTVSEIVASVKVIACAVDALSLLLLLRNFFLEPFARLNPDRDSDAHVFLRDRNQFHCRLESGNAFVAQVRQVGELPKSDQFPKRSRQRTHALQHLVGTHQCLGRSCRKFRCSRASGRFGGAEPCEPRRHRAFPRSAMSPNGSIDALR